jgi:dephospho-CoA kinase
MNKNNFCIILTGPPCAGKSTCAEFLKNEFGLEIINVGDLLFEKLKSDGIVCNTRDEIGPAFLKHYLVDDIFKIIVEYIDGFEQVVIDGVRLESICYQLKEYYSSSLWYIDTYLHIREQRLANRIKKNTIKKNVSIKHMINNYQKYDSEFKNIYMISDIIIKNNNTKSEFFNSCKKEYLMNKKVKK